MLEFTGFSLYRQENFLKYSVCGEREDGMFSRCHASPEVLQFKNTAKT